MVSESEGQSASTPWQPIDAEFLDRCAPLAEDELRHFLDGGGPDWRHSGGPYANGVRLPVLSRGWDPGARLDEGPEVSTFHLLLGPRGDGKSTLLRQVAAERARRAEMPVFWLDPRALAFDARETLSGLGEAEDVVLVVDDAHRHLESLFSLMRRSHRSGTRRLHLIAAARDEDWTLGMRGRGGWNALCRLDVHTAGELGPEEAAGLVAAWSSVPGGLEDLEDCPEADRAERVRAELRRVRSEAGESLFGGILELRFPRGIADHVDRLLERLHAEGDSLLHAFGAVALVDAIGPARREGSEWRRAHGLDARLVAELAAPGAAADARTTADTEASKGAETAADPGADLGAVASARWQEALQRLSRVAPIGVEAGQGLVGSRHRRIAECVVHQLASDDFGVSIPQLLIEMVRGSIQLAEVQPPLLHQRELSSIARAAQRALPAILSATPDDPDDRSLAAADDIAIAVADAAWQAQPRGDRLVDAVVVRRRAQDPEDAAALAERHFPDLSSVPDRWTSGRSFLRAWARAEQGAAALEDDRGRRLDRLDRAVAIALYGASDEFGGGQAPLQDRDLGHLLCLLHEALSKGGAAGAEGDAERALQGLAGALPHAQDLAGYADRLEVDPAVAPAEAADLDALLVRLSREAQQAGLLPVPSASGALCFSQLLRVYRHSILSRTGPLFTRRPREVSPDSLYEAFTAYFDEDEGKELSEEQDTAILHVLSGENVVLHTATGTGKSTVALAAHFAALCAGEVSVYTAPTKALVNEKFFELCGVMGAQNVGLVTGDAVVNAEAPVLCCTAEILSQWALRQGDELKLGWVIMDEFHYIADRARGVAWHLPLLLLRGTRFLVMSATLGDAGAMRDLLQLRTGFTTAVVESMERPVELAFEYREWKVDEAVAAAAEKGLLPAYLVHFEKEAAGRQASALTSRSDLLDAERKRELTEIVRRQAFRTPFGKKLESYLKKGVGVHHSGLLPGYRRLVEQLSKKRLLGVVCGTDTLGVGVNLPIRTVIFTQLCKFDGRKNRRLGVREFHQIAGRAGRRGHDERGDVWALAPEEAVDRKRAQQKGKKKPKAKPAVPGRSKPTWTEKDFEILREARSPALVPVFEVRSEMVLLMYARANGGAAALAKLLRSQGTERKILREHFRAANAIKRSLIADGSLVLARPEGEPPRWRPSMDLPPILGHQTVGLFLPDALSVLDPADPDYALDVLSVVEATVEDPRSLLSTMLKKRKGALARELMAAGIHGGELTARLGELRLPQPCPPIVLELYQHWQHLHPWVGLDEFSPKSIVREMFEERHDFADYAREHQLLSEEGVLLRYLSSVARSLRHELPEYVCREESIQEIVEWLDLTVRAVDQSVAEEWERLDDPSAAPSEQERALEIDITRKKHAFKVLVRNAAFAWVRALDRREEASLVSEDLSLPVLRKAMDRYWEQHDEIRTDADARGPDLFQLDEQGRVFQTLLDPEGHRDTILRGQVDLEASATEGRAVLRLLAVEEPGADWAED